MASEVDIQRSDSTAIPDTSAEPEEMAEFLREVVPYYIGLQNCGSLPEDSFSDEKTLESLSKLANDPQIVSAIAFSENELDEGSGDAANLKFVARLEMKRYNTYPNRLAIVKLNQYIDGNKKLGPQLLILQLGEATHFEAIHSLISGGFSHFKTVIRQEAKKDRDEEKLLHDVEKKFAELETGLLQLQQNVGVPEVRLAIHPDVQNIIDSTQEKDSKPSEQEMQKIANDQAKLSEIQVGVSKWIEEIKNLSTHDREISSGSAINEISFWMNMSKALNDVQVKRKSLEVETTVEILRQARRFNITLSLDSDTGLNEAIQRVNDYCNLLRDMPLEDLLSATTLAKVKEAILNIFQHMKKFRNTRYPVTRLISLIEAISRDLQKQLLKAMKTRNLMHLPYHEFGSLIQECSNVFKTWSDEHDRLLTVMRDASKARDKGSGHKFPHYYRASQHPHRALQVRLERLKNFRIQHEQLREVVSKVLRPHTQGIVPFTPATTPSVEKSIVESGVTAGEEAAALEEITDAFNYMKEIDCMDTSREGEAICQAAEAKYEEKIDRVEARIIERLRDQLGLAKNANEMFRIFSQYNALFVRPKVRGAIREYQSQLIQKVKEDIDSLLETYRKGYEDSPICHLMHIRYIPPTAGLVLWMKLINSQLIDVGKRVESVLGKDWETHVDGKRLKEDLENFKANIKKSIDETFEGWSAKAAQKSISVGPNLFEIEGVRQHDGTKKLRIDVNFNFDMVLLSKEVKVFKSVGARVPLQIINKAFSATGLHSSAVSLRASLSAYNRANTCIGKDPDLANLVTKLRSNVHAMIIEGCSHTWESYKLETFTVEFTKSVDNYYEKVEELMETSLAIETGISSLDTCAYSQEAFLEALNTIQTALEEIDMKQYSGVDVYRRKINSIIEEKLMNRLKIAIESWTKHLRILCDQNLAFADDDADETPTAGAAPVVKPKLLQIIHEFRITSQVMFLHPPVNNARTLLTQQLYGWAGIVLHLPQLRRARRDHRHDEGGRDFTILLEKLDCNGGAESLALKTIEELMKRIEMYVSEWYHFQALWDLEMNALCQKLGNDLNKWMDLLLGLKKARRTFDTTEAKTEFGPVVIDYGRVQQKVTMRYDIWHKDLLTKFATLLQDNMHLFYNVISKARTDLEQQSVDSGSTSDSVELITFVQSLKRKVHMWEENVESYKNGQKCLEKQRYQFTNKWLYAENVEGQWSAFKDILRRKDAAIQTRIASLQTKIAQEHDAVEAKTEKLLNEWDENKPVSGSIRPEKAVEELSVFESKFSRISDERDRLTKAKEALEMQSSNSTLGAVDMKLNAYVEELNDLKGVWSQVKMVWTGLDELKEKVWMSVQPRKLRTGLDELLEKLRSMPSNLRTYSSYEFIESKVRGYLKINPLITELKSDALKERHWNQIMKHLGISCAIKEMTLGHIWDAELQRNEKAIRDVLTTAQGELALENFIKQVRETWVSYELDMVTYQDKCRLIRGWDDLFEKLKEHINSLNAMKLSPYFKVFEEEGTTWEHKLNKINDVFDSWIDVQRKWVYLDGIFTGSSDIQALLPVESNRFNSTSHEFMSLMKRVAKNPKVLEVLNIDRVQQTLERIGGLLTKIQKGLSDYLERQRSSFPRFYFVGDEDLLEIIGNSKNIGRIQKHFRKMFAGVAALIVNEEETLVTGIVSREGEEVSFLRPIDVVKNPSINEWLEMTEKEMKNTLANLLLKCVEGINSLSEGSEISGEKFLKWVEKYPAQIVNLAVRIKWTEITQNAISVMEQKGGFDKSTFRSAELYTEKILNILADSVLYDQEAILRRKLENLITEYVHKRDMTRILINNEVSSTKDFMWMKQMRCYFDPKASPLQCLKIEMANAEFYYGFEYLGVIDKLVQTPLTDRCYLTMTQALHNRLGGSPFGPAGTGKTESVKALGHDLGKFVIVFNCDEKFDFQAMGRIFVGLCQVGAWGCFDEFNRLEERMLSAVSQQIQTIQEALRSRGKKGVDKIEIELIERQVKVKTDMAIFITMNPSYAGRSNLPDNLKKLFMSLAMTKPNGQLIAQVMLFSQGFRSAEKLAEKVVPFFKLCGEQLSHQSHYEFGLRALKYVLISAGSVKRQFLQKMQASEDDTKIKEPTDNESIYVREQEILIQAICETMVPKLIVDDIPLMYSLLNDVFPGVSYTPSLLEKLEECVHSVCKEQHYLCGIDEGAGQKWVEKLMQLYQISGINHGVMLVGPSGSGKTAAWRTLLTALERFDGVEGVAHVIDPKAMSKEKLYGNLDPNTREWTDGLFTHVLRRIIDNMRNELQKRQWIVFDGDVDPEWVENLNSVLDDNKLLTLPNGERLALPSNVRIVFEVQDLRFATPATVSRCGMIWFSGDLVDCQMMFHNYLSKLNSVVYGTDDIDDDFRIPGMQKANISEGQELDEAVVTSAELLTQREIVRVLKKYFAPGALITQCLREAEKLEHIMDFTNLRALNSLFSMLNQAVRVVHEYNARNIDFPLDNQRLESFIAKTLCSSIIWAFSGDCKLTARQDMSDFIRRSCDVDMPGAPGSCIIDYEALVNGEWAPWQNKVPKIEIETHRVTAVDLVVPTLDTVRHRQLLYTWLQDHRPLILCGPPGSGKTMTLLEALRNLSNMEVVALNFSSATTPELMLKTFDHYCEYRKTPNGVVLSPVMPGKWLILFCDEINLPDADKYGTQRVISFIRQLVELGGFYRSSDHSWVSLERIQFVGACNPPTDPGRKPLTHRFLRHVPVVYVDYPGELSLKQIYGTFNRAMLKMTSKLRSYAEPLTNAMVKFYLLSQETFTQDTQPHYIYSPRELTRWVRGMHEAIEPLDEEISLEKLVRLWAHEGLRLFQDRLVNDEGRKWTDKNIDSVAQECFPNADLGEALKRPILYSTWLSKNYVPVDRELLRSFTKERLKVFYEEELDVPLVLFDEVLDHVLRIDRIFRQPQGHLLMVGTSGSGKTTLSRFVAWMNGLSVYQIKVHNMYSAENFDEDLRNVLRRAGCKAEKICFILDESNILESSFLERMNTLLANGEVPGLFEGDEFNTLMTQCKEGASRSGVMLDSPEELYRWFTQQVCRNLHVVFTMNPSEEGLKDRASTSPALFNRCVVNWYGDWPDTALFQVGRELTTTLDVDPSGGYKPPDFFPRVCALCPSVPDSQAALVNAFVYVHQTVKNTVQRLRKRGHRIPITTPRHFLDFIQHYVKLFHEKREDLEEQQLHLNIGVRKIDETVEQVEELQKSLAQKRQKLEAKNLEASQKLQKMLADQSEAERQKGECERLQVDLKKKTKMIFDKQESVKGELADVEPAVVEAKEAVQSIKKQHIVELKAFSNPPPLVKLALESICCFLGENYSDWKAIRSTVVKENFINTLLNFQTESLDDSLRQTIRTKYFSNPDYTFEKCDRASKACGPMVKWMIAQVNYADILKSIDPLRNELKNLEDEAHKAERHAEKLSNNVVELEDSISKLKEEYAALVSEAERIKSDLSHVQSKVDRSVSLLQSLGSEKDRWSKSRQAFGNQMQTLVGDVLLSSAFMAYAGYFDQRMRQSLFNAWTNHLQQALLGYRPELARTEYLSTPDDRIKWQSNSLPADDLCTENAIMLKRFNRYPLVIDPSGQATEFLMKELEGKKITKTSFLDTSFRKNLESSLRFGNPLLVQDVENYDPILNPVLNREVRRTGGRILMSLGDQDIDLSPSFSIYLTTRDPTAEFPPDLCSRVTFVNFTVTRGSLQSQCLHRVLKSERPDIEEKRCDLLNVQGEFRLRLRHLEKQLLQALNDAKGRILDDDKLLSTLETLKKEAREVMKKVDETDAIIAEVDAASEEYSGLASACSAIFFTMESLNQIYFLYQYSLQFFLELFNEVLLNDKLKNMDNYSARLKLITDDIFSTVYLRVSRGMLYEDRLILAILISRIYIKLKEPMKKRRSASELLSSEEEENYQFLLRGQNSSVDDKGFKLIDGLNKEQSEKIVRLSKLKSFKNVVAKVGENKDKLAKWLIGLRPEEERIDGLLCESAPSSDDGLHQLLLIQALRPDRLRLALKLYVANVMGNAFFNKDDEVVEIHKIVDFEVKSKTPLMLCSVPGHDASWIVEDLCVSLGKQLRSVPLGSSEGFEQAEKFINSSVKSGQWVLLKNCHLAPAWLVQLEKRLHSMNPHPDFRLFIATEIHAKLSVNLLRMSRVLTFEPAPGVRSNLQRTLHSIDATRMAREPVERSKLYFLLAWFHAIVQERLRYCPLGWSKAYEFTESDLRTGLDTIDSWLDSRAMGRTNVKVESLPWDAFSALLTQAIYGGKIDNEYDYRLLVEFVQRLFQPSCFLSETALMRTGDDENICLPDGSKREAFLNWVDAKLGSMHQTPAWLGLPDNAELVLLTSEGKRSTAKLLKMQYVEDEEGESVVEMSMNNDSQANVDKITDKPQWMKQIGSQAKAWLAQLPSKLEKLQRTSENIKDPLFRFFEREVKLGSALLNTVKNDLSDCVEICVGEKRQTNYHRQLLSDLVKGVLPSSWKRYKIPKSTTVLQWMADFLERMKQMKKISESPANALKRCQIWIGGLFMPEAFVTATRQYVAQANSWPLEQLELDVTVYEKDPTKDLSSDGFSFIVLGLVTQGANCNANVISLSQEIYCDMPFTVIRWNNISDKKSVQADKVSIPVYLNSSRTDPLFSMSFISQRIASEFYERGVAILCTTHLS